MWVFERQSVVSGAVLSQHVGAAEELLSVACQVLTRALTPAFTPSFPLSLPLSFSSGASHYCAIFKAVR